MNRKEEGVVGHDCKREAGDGCPRSLVFPPLCAHNLCVHDGISFRTFKEETMPVIDRLQRLGKVRQISAVPPPDVVFATIRRIFEVRLHCPIRPLHLTLLVLY